MNNSKSCTNKNCNKKVPKNRKKYCSSDCLLSHSRNKVKDTIKINKQKMRKGFIKTKIPKTKQDKNKLVPIVGTGMLPLARMNLFSSMRHFGFKPEIVEYRKQRVDHVYKTYKVNAYCLKDIENVIKLIDKRHKETCKASYKYSIKVYLGYWELFEGWLEKEKGK